MLFAKVLKMVELGEKLFVELNKALEKCPDV